MNRFTALSLLLLFVSLACSQELSSVREIADAARDSIVVVSTEDGDGGESEMGSGFVIDARGLIATSLHVIREARPIWVETRNGKRHLVTEVYASDRTFDLAIVRINADDKLTAVALANDELKEGQVAVAIGHPLGLKHSVVSGIVAGERDFNGADMWQVAMAIEPGNSGGPLLDMRGKVHGVMALKSVGSRSFGFAVKVSQLRQLVDNPNPIAIEQWQTIGQLDSRRWQPKMGARWRQRSGRIVVETPGSGFGGRSLLLRSDAPPEPPFELAVSVKLEDETGAAGLVFHSDGEDKHYGFYPSNGKLRLTSFEGPSVFTWNVIRELPAPNYLPGEWNEIKVRVEKERIAAFVNGELLITINEVVQPAGKIGLCKFRDTKAQFKGFRFGDKITSQVTSPEKRAEITQQLAKLDVRAELKDEELAEHQGDVLSRIMILEQQARDLESQAMALRGLGKDLHIASVCAQLSSIVNKPHDADIDLLAGALQIAKLDNAELEIQSYIDIVDSMAEEIRSEFKPVASEADRLVSMNDFLFKKSGFHGSRTEYSRAANSHLDRVIDDREGLPITLSVLYMTLAERVGLNVVGVGLPGHFVVRHEPKKGDKQLVDVFDRGKLLSIDDANVMIFRMIGRQPPEDAFETAKHIDILSRMLNNLSGGAQNRDDGAAMRRYVEALAAISPEDPSLRGMRAILRHQEGRKQAAIDDLDWIISAEPEGVNLQQIREIRARLKE